MLRTQDSKSGTAALPLTILAGFLLAVSGGIHAADHQDTPGLKEEGNERFDALLTGMFTFQRGENLVVILNTNPMIPPTRPEYIFPTDVEFRIQIDNNSAVRFPSTGDSLRYGGEIVDSNAIEEDITIRIVFKPDGVTPELSTEPAAFKQHVKLWTGLRDDPFINFVREGLNIGALVLEMPLTTVSPDRQPLLIWGTSTVENFDGLQQELTGRSARSQDNPQINTFHPRDHMAVLAGQQADVLIFDPRRKATFPNGRELTDDVGELLCSKFGECRILLSSIMMGGLPRRTTNDVPYLSYFPYLGLPHAPSSTD